MSEGSSNDGRDIHLLIFVHGLWGNPSHLNNLAKAIRDRHSEDKLQILIPKRNSGTLTYDGIETGGERVAQEVEDEIEELKRQKKTVKRFSVVGYSLGGLLARYAVGLLANKGFFDDVEPVNFTTFATPHLGTRTPLVGWLSHVYNDLGPRTLSASGRQMWMIDDFRNTGRPLLSILADPTAIFQPALKRFKNVSLYSNIVNDRSVPFYTSCIESKDPYVDLDAIDINYVPDTDDVILQHPLGDEGARAVSAVPKAKPLTYYESMVSSASRFVDRAPLLFFFVALAPIGIAGFLGSSVVNTYKSAARIRDHEQGRAGTDYSKYRFPLPDTVRQKALETFAHATHAQHQDTLRDAAAADDDDENGTANGNANGVSKEEEPTAIMPTASATPSTTTAADEPAPPGGPAHACNATLALTPEQFAMIAHLDAAGFRKYPVHIKQANHSHAAIIVRMDRRGFGDGKVVARHWAERWEI